MAGPDKEDPVDTMASVEVPVKASPPREKPPPPPKDGSDSGSKAAPPPDGGWGWVVVFASFMIHIIADGITYSFGVFLVELIDKFDADRGAASLIPSILVGITLGSGPIASYFTNRYGCRAVTIAGAILAAAGLALSCAANSIVVLYFTVGVLTGLGFGLIYLPAIVSVSIYFEKKRAFATGIAVCGSGLGTFIMSPVTKGLISYFGWQGAMLVTAGLVLSCILFGCLMRPVPQHQEDPADQEEQEALTIPQGKTGGPLPELLLNGNTISPMKPFSEQVGVSNGCTDVSRMAMSHPAFLDQAEKTPVYFGSAAQFGAGKVAKMSQSSSQVMGRKDIFYSGSLLNIPEYKKDPARYRRSMMDCKEEDLSPSNEEPQSNICCIKADSKQAKILHKMLDFSLFKDPIFMMYATSNFLTSIGFNVPYVFTVDRAELWGMDGKDAAFLLSVIGISNTVARLILGWLSDRTWVNRLYLYNFCLVICGVSMALSPFCTTYTTQAIYCALFGITSGAYVGLTSVVLVDLLGLDKLTNAFGLLLMFQGIASVMGPPVIGAFYDSIGDYDAGFYFAGSMIFVSGAMLFAIPALQRHLANKRPSFKITSGKGQDELLVDA